MENNESVLKAQLRSRAAEDLAFACEMHSISPSYVSKERIDELRSELEKFDA